MYPILVGAAAVYDDALAARTNCSTVKSALARKSTRIITPVIEELYKL